MCLSPNKPCLSHKMGKSFTFFVSFFSSVFDRRQLSEVFCQKDILNKLYEIVRKTPVSEFLFSIVAEEGLQLYDKDTVAQVFSYGLKTFLRTHFS